MNRYFNKIIILMMFLFYNCGYPPLGYLPHSTNTQVILSEANYRIINTVSGQSSAYFILGIGPFNDRLVSRAKKDMLENANLSGGGNKSRALINMTTDIQYRYFWYIFPWWFSKTVYITADVIEFKEE